MHRIQKYGDEHIDQDQQDQDIPIEIICKQVEQFMICIIVIGIIRQEKGQHKAHCIQKDEVQVLGPVFAAAFIHASVLYSCFSGILRCHFSDFSWFPECSVIQSTGESAQSHRSAALPSSCCRLAGRDLG